MSAFRLVVQFILLKVCFIPEIVAILMSNSHKQGIVVWYYPKNLRFDRVRTYLQITQNQTLTPFSYLWMWLCLLLLVECPRREPKWRGRHFVSLSAQGRIVLYKSPPNLEKQRALNSRFFRVIFIPVTAAFNFFFWCDQLAREILILMLNLW